MTARRAEAVTRDSYGRRTSRARPESRGEIGRGSPEEGCRKELSELTRSQLVYLIRFFVAVGGDVDRPRDATRSMLTREGRRYVMALDLDHVKAKAYEYTRRALEGN